MDSLLPGRLRAWTTSIFGLDPRGLAAFRVGLGALMLVDVLERSQDLTTFYTDAGVLPRALVPSLSGRVCLHMLSGSAGFEGLLFVLAAMAALAVILGFRTRTALAVAWVLMFSLQSRNPLVLYGGDIELRMLAFWGLFLPLEGSPSVDRGRGPEGAPADPILSFGSVGYVGQIALIYVVTAALKTGAAWHDGTAVWYALNIDHFTSGAGRALLQFPELLHLATYATYALEAVGPWLLLVPLARVRAAVALSFMALHCSFLIFMEIGLFPWVSMLAWIPLLPAPVWDRLRWPRGSGTPYAALPLTQGLAVLGLAYALWWNLGTVAPGRFAVPDAARAPARALRLDQYWDMFAPEPYRDDGWWVLVGNRVDGQMNDAMHGGPLRWDKPESVVRLYKSERWRKFMRNLWDRKYASLREPYLRWICDAWNAHAAPPAKLKSVQMVYLREDSPAPGGTAILKKLPLLTRSCGSGPGPTG